jgi:hypothetical protein
MRRTLASLTSALLLTAAIGCVHYAGVCDCGYDGCCGGPIDGPGPHARPEAIKVMPKAGEVAPAPAPVPAPGK